MKIVSDVNAVLYILLTLFYFYQGVYVLIALIGKKKKNNIKEDNAALHKYALPLLLHEMRMLLSVI